MAWRDGNGGEDRARMKLCAHLIYLGIKVMVQFPFIDNDDHDEDDGTGLEVLVLILSGHSL